MSKKRKVRKIYYKIVTAAERVESISNYMHELENSRDRMILSELTFELARRILHTAGKLEKIFDL